MRAHGLLVAAIAAAAVSGCGDDPADSGERRNRNHDANDGEPTCDPSMLPYARSLESFEPGEGAGVGADALPGVVLGPPDASRGPEQGSLDVVSLGVGGEIVLGFGPRRIVDGPGPDFIVFENVFWVGGDPSVPFAELAQVSVSEDGLVWSTWSCDPLADGPPWSGCAGWGATLAFDPCDGLTATAAGGDAFDLAVLGVDTARFVRITDLAEAGTAPSAGFDLDAVGLLNWESF